MFLLWLFLLFDFSTAKKKKKTKKDDTLFDKVQNEEEFVSRMPKRTALPTQSPQPTQTPYPTVTRTPIEWRKLVDFDKINPKAFKDIFINLKPTPNPTPSPVPPPTPTPSPYPTPSPPINKYWYLYQLRPKPNPNKTDPYDKPQKVIHKEHIPITPTQIPSKTPEPTKFSVYDNETEFDMFKIDIGYDVSSFNITNDENNTNFENRKRKPRKTRKESIKMKNRRLKSYPQYTICHRAAKLIDGNCICQNGLIDDGFQKCIYPIPTILSISPRKLSSLVKTLVKITIQPVGFIPQSAFCMVGTTVIRGTVISETEIECEVTPKIGRSRIGVSFDGVSWDRERYPIVFEKKFIAFLKLFTKISNSLIFAVILIGSAIAARFWYLNREFEKLKLEIEERRKQFRELKKKRESKRKKTKPKAKKRAPQIEN